MPSTNQNPAGYQWPPFARNWGLSLPPFQERPCITPVGEETGSVRDWQEILIRRVDWPSTTNFSTAEALRMKMMIVRPFAQVMMPLQFDYVTFRRKVLETIEHSKVQHASLAETVGAVTHNLSTTKLTLDAHAGRLGSCEIRCEDCIGQLEHHVKMLHGKILNLEARNLHLESQIANLQHTQDDVIHSLPWQSVDPRDSVSVAERIEAAQAYASSRGPSPIASRVHSRTSSPAPSRDEVSVSSWQ